VSFRHMNDLQQIPDRLLTIMWIDAELSAWANIVLLEAVRAVYPRWPRYPSS
jgi:hypothetical protein